MNKTWSIILIVVASIVVLGGTYWYFGMQKPKSQEGPPPMEVVQPAETMPAVAKEKDAVASVAEAKQPVVESKQSPAEAEKKSIESKPLPPKDEKRKALPGPIAPAMTQRGGFALPSSDTKSEGEKEAIKPSTSVLTSETLPAKAEAPTLAAKENEDEGTETEPVVAEPVAEDSPLTPLEDVVGEADTDEENETGQEVVIEDLTPVADSQIETAPVVEQIVVAKNIPTPPTNKVFRSGTSALDKKSTDEDKPTLEGSLSVSFLERNFPKEFNSTEKSFTVSVDLMSQKETFGWGGTLEVGKITETDLVQISLLAKTEWKLGKGVVTFPLSISLGPTLFIDPATNTPEFGMKAKLGAGVTYAISESFRLFYAVGLGATYNFQDKSSFRLVLEPIRIGVGFSF